MVCDASEENFVVIYTAIAHVTDVNSFHPHFIIVNYVKKVFVKTVRTKKHIMRNQAMIYQTVKISINEPLLIILGCDLNSCTGTLTL